MKFADLISDVFLNLTRKKMRTTLTMVGVVIGAVAVVTTVSLGHGLSFFLDQQVRAVANPLTVEAWPKKGGSPNRAARGMFKNIGKAPQEIKKEKEDEFFGALKIKTIENEMVEKMREIEGVERVQPKVFVLARSVQLDDDTREFDTIVVPWIDAGAQVLSTGPGFSSIDAHECIISEAYLESMGFERLDQLMGRMVTIRVTEHPMFALVGRGGLDSSALEKIQSIATLLKDPPKNRVRMVFSLFFLLRDLANSEELKAMAEPEGEPVEFRAKVVGISKKGLLTNIVYVPDGFAIQMGRVLFNNQEMYTEKNWGMGMVLLAKSKEDVPRVKAAVKALGFRAHTMEDLIGKLHDFFATLQSIMVLFGSIAFFVATFSIVNTLLMAVVERKREIGVLQALGATRAHILKMFACEAAAIGLLGGILGGLFGWVMAQAGNAFSHYKWGHIIGSADLFVMPGWLFPVLLVFTTLLGLVAGVYPAWRASRLDPVAALRYE
jgi:putative ABC transport system permease protein